MSEENLVSEQFRAYVGLPPATTDDAEPEPFEPPVLEPDPEPDPEPEPFEPPVLEPDPEPLAGETE